jgi:polysaccharide deacetylase family protein (PEP-CTERM system associated)
MLKHAFTVDLEDWYHGIPVAAETKRTAERRLHVGTDLVLEMLAQHDHKGTFFVLSSTAREHPDILHRIAQAGHDIGSHGLSHDLIYEMSLERFRDETRTSIRDIEDCVGVSIRSYRAAYFSITKQSLWALDILVEEGVRFDSSIFPVKNWRYGIEDYSRRPTVVQTSAGPLLEFPISTRRVFGHNLPTTGGAYFRLYPYAVTRANIRAAERDDAPVVFYIHPWELDPEHPRTQFNWKAKLTHYANLRSTRGKLEKLCSEFKFTTLAEVLNRAFPGFSQ